MSVCCASQSKLLIVDRAKAKLFCARMHYPFDVEVIAKGMRDPLSVIFLEGVAYVADSGNNRVGYVVLSKSVFLEPKKMKVDDLREAVEKREIACTRTKKAMTEALQKWIMAQQKAEGIKADELNTLKLNRTVSRPVSLAVAGNEVIFVGDSHTHSIYQVAVDNNGAFLRGQVLSEISIADSLPYGISVLKNSLFVADASSKGGLWKINLLTRQQELVLANGTTTIQCVHGVAVHGEKVYFTDRQARKVYQLENENVSVIAGCGQEGSADGSSRNASFSQPTGICIEQETLFVTDSAVGSVRMITQTSAMCGFLKQINLLYRSFGVHLKGHPPEQHSMDEVIEALESIYHFCTSWMADIQSFTEKRGVVQGPEGIVSSKTIESVQMMLQSAKELKTSVNHINPQFLELIKPSSMLTLIVEHLFSKMRTRNDTPTVLEFAYLFGPTIKELLKELTNCGYHYFTGSGSHYEKPDQLPLQFAELPNIPKPSVLNMAKKDQETLRHWRDAFGKSVRQLTVRNQSTKDNVGTLPLYAYTPAPPPPVPVTFEGVTENADALSRATSSAQIQVHTDRALLYSANSVVVLKPGYPPHLNITAPFSLGIVTEDVVEDDLCHSVNVTLFLPSFDDCLTFCRRDDVTVHRDAVAIEVETAKVIHSDDKLINLSDEDFSALVRYLQKDTDSLSENESCEEQDRDECETDEGEDDSFVMVNSRVMLTSSGRTVKTPLRLDL